VCGLFESGQDDVAVILGSDLPGCLERDRARARRLGRRRRGRGRVRVRLTGRRGVRRRLTPQKEPPGEACRRPKALADRTPVDCCLRSRQSVRTRSEQQPVHGRPRSGHVSCSDPLSRRLAERLRQAPRATRHSSLSEACARRRRHLDADAAMALSSVSVIANALRLRRMRLWAHVRWWPNDSLQPFGRVTPPNATTAWGQVLGTGPGAPRVISGHVKEHVDGAAKPHHSAKNKAGSALPPTPRRARQPPW
jgi:hypothetical protein